MNPTDSTLPQAQSSTVHIRVAILDMYDGKANQGMRCIHQLLREWTIETSYSVYYDLFDVRVKNELPDTSYDIYISTGGPGDPLASRFEDWDINWCRWLDSILRWNEN